MVEKMIRQVLQHNTFFAIWPEGFPNRDGKVRQGFSSVARLYSVINCQEDKIPFLPVLIQGSGVYIYEVKVKRGPIAIRYGNPFYIPREWLKTPEEGGKSPREITDYIMMKLAKMQKQTELVPNPRLEHRKNILQDKKHNSSEL
jgi:hypothetical protein